MTTTIEFITALFCQIDDQLAGLPKRLCRKSPKTGKLRLASG
jgi:hypothetical protein